MNKKMPHNNSLQIDLIIGFDQFLKIITCLLKFVSDQDIGVDTKFSKFKFLCWKTCKWALNAPLSFHQSINLFPLASATCFPFPFFFLFLSSFLSLLTSPFSFFIVSLFFSLPSYRLRLFPFFFLLPVTPSSFDLFFFLFLLFLDPVPPDLSSGDLWFAFFTSWL